MAEASPKKKTKKAIRIRQLNVSDPTGSSFSGDNDDHFALIAGGGEGGFLSLEEIDESEWVFSGAPVPNLNAKLKTNKKRKNGGEDANSNGDESCTKADEDVHKPKKMKKNRKKKEKKKKKKNEEKKKHEEKKKNEEVKEEVAAEDPCPKLDPILDDEAVQNDCNLADVKTDCDDDDELLLNDDEIYAWKELRLHPLLIKSVRRLGFREPTPIQKACIPVAAHQGKDVIGAAETGSGKTLAFGLPILQRLLEEREKAARSLQNEEKSVETQRGPLRALIITPTRELALQVSDHLKAAAKYIDIRVVPIVGGMSSEKQERLLRGKPEIIVGTPGRLWELMLGGNQHLVELHSLSFFVLDEADRMIENGHFRELQSIIDMLPTAGTPVEQCSQTSETSETIANFQRKKRQTFVFSATIALSDNFRKKLKRSSSTSKAASTEGISSIETLSERAGMRPDAAIVDLTSATIMADKLEESFLECREEDKEAYLYYILSVHGQGRTLVFCTSIAALRRISTLLRYLAITAWTLHAQMQQRARLKAVDRFRASEHGVLIATDVAARGLDIPGIRTVVHFQLPHSAEVYIHRSGRTARASSDGCSIALISPGDKTKFVSLCRSMSKESLRQFPLEDSYLPEVMRRVTLARQIDKLLRKNSQENVKKSWLERTAESMELTLESSSSEEETMTENKQKNRTSLGLKTLQQDLKDLLAQPLQPRKFSRRYMFGAGISPVLHKQLEQMHSKEKKGAQFVVIGHERIEPLEALRNSGREVCIGGGKTREVRMAAEKLKRELRDEKNKARDQRRNRRKQLKARMK